MHLLVIGASGYIGSEIYKESVHKNIDVIGTRCQSKCEGLYQLDITKSCYQLPEFGDGEKYAIICSADSKIDYAFMNKEKAFYKNVTSTIRLIDRLKDSNYKVVFLSSDNVFDGTRGYYTEEDVTNPINVYGKMKEEVEQYILSLKSKDCIMRIGKTIGNFAGENDMLMDWYQKAKVGNSIYCIKGNILTPIYVGDVVHSILTVVDQNLEGIYNVVSDIAYSRTELCRKFLETIKLETPVYEKDITEFVFKDKRPLNIALCNNKFVSKTGAKFKSMEEIFGKFLQEIMY